MKELTMLTLKIKLPVILLAKDEDRQAKTKPEVSQGTKERNIILWKRKKKLGEVDLSERQLERSKGSGC